MKRVRYERKKKGPIDKFFPTKKVKKQEDDDRFVDPFKETNVDLSNVVTANNFVFDPKNFELSDSDSDYVPSPKKCNDFVWNRDQVESDDEEENEPQENTNAKQEETFEVIVDAIEKKSQIPMSEEQTTICKYVYEAKHRNIVIDSVAGSGKTTTLLQCLWFIPSNARVLLLSFNKNIQNALQQAVNKTSVHVLTQLKRDLARCYVFTCHAHGFSALKTYYPNASQETISDNKTQIVNQVLEKESPETQKLLEHWKWHLPKMVRILLNLAVNCENCPVLSENFVMDVGKRYGIAVPEMNNPFKRNNHLLTAYMSVLTKSLELVTQRTNNFDYNDMIYLPLFLKIPFMKYDYVLVDESQDLNAAQVELIRRSVEPEKGRVIFVGDQNQSIYGFRGVEMNAIEKVTNIFDAVQLPLHTCWRCPKNVVAVAQSVVPRIRASPFAKEGIATVRQEDELMDLLLQRDEEMTHAVLCRTNSPLIDLAIQLLDNEIPYILSAPSLRETLHNLANQVNDATWLHSRNLLNKTNKFIEWKKNSGKEMGEDMIEKSDQLDSLRNIILSINGKGSFSINQVHSQIDRVFGDIDDSNANKKSVRLSTIHSVKGMEFDCVYMIATRLLPHPSSKGSSWQKQQEENLKYVAFTRAKQELYYMQDFGDDASRNNDYNI